MGLDKVFSLPQQSHSLVLPNKAWNPQPLGSFQQFNIGFSYSYWANIKHYLSSPCFEAKPKWFFRVDPDPAGRGKLRWNIIDGSFSSMPVGARRFKYEDIWESCKNTKKT